MSGEKKASLITREKAAAAKAYIEQKYSELRKRAQEKLQRCAFPSTPLSCVCAFTSRGEKRSKKMGIGGQRLKGKEEMTS